MTIFSASKGNLCHNSQKGGKTTFDRVNSPESVSLPLFKVKISNYSAELLVTKYYFFYYWFTDLTEEYIPTGFFRDGEVEVELDTKGIQQVCLCTSIIFVITHYQKNKKEWSSVFFFFVFFSYTLTLSCWINLPCSFLIFSQSDYLIQIVDIGSHTEWQTVQI